MLPFHQSSYFVSAGMNMPLLGDDRGELRGVDDGDVLVVLY